MLIAVYCCVCALTIAALPGGLPTDRVDSQEAISKAHTAWASTTVPASIQALLDSPAAEVGQGTSTFWVMVAALKRFVVRACVRLRARLQAAGVC